MFEKRPLLELWEMIDRNWDLQKERERALRFLKLTGETV